MFASVSLKTTWAEDPSATMAFLTAPLAYVGRLTDNFASQGRHKPRLPSQLALSDEAAFAPDRERHDADDVLILFRVREVDRTLRVHSQR
jgi:hypothetical protein